MADEALTCFTSLLENVPKWIANLESILQTASDRQREFQALDQASTPNRILKRRLSKSSSMKSRRSADDGSARDGSALRQRLRHLTNADVLRLRQRKQDTLSELSGKQSGPSNFRVRNAGTIYFDGEVQKQFERMVRDVGSSRNAIRKGKMSAKVDALSRTGSSSSDCSSETEEFSPITAKLNFKSSRPRSRPISSFACDDGSAAFDRVDGSLDKAQSLCEHAAHQVLRDGDCTLEITTAKEHLAEALKHAEAELPAIRRRADKSAERRRRSLERQRIDEEAQQKLRQADTTLTSKKSRDLVCPAFLSFPSELSLEVDELEVDDAEDDSEGEMPAFNMSTIPVGKFTSYRTARMPTPAYGGRVA